MRPILTAQKWSEPGLLYRFGILRRFCFICIPDINPSPTHPGTVVGVSCTVFRARCFMHDVSCTVFRARCFVHGVSCTMFDVRARCSFSIARCSCMMFVHDVRARCSCTMFVHDVRGTMLVVRCLWYEINAERIVFVFLGNVGESVTELWL